MVRYLCMSNIRAARRHMASRAVRLFGMMLGVTRRVMACEAFSSEIVSAFFCRRRDVRIVTACARHGITARFLAFALGQSLDLADRPQGLIFPAGEQVVAHIVRKQVARTKVVSMTAGTLNRHSAFQVAFHADGITPCRREPRRIDDCSADRKSTRLNSSHLVISYAVFCLTKK